MKLGWVTLLLAVPLSAQSAPDVRLTTSEWGQAHYARQDAIVKFESWTRIPDGRGWFRLRTKDEIAAAIAKDQPQLDQIDAQYRAKIDPALKKLKIKLASGYQADDVRRALSK